MVAIKELIWNHISNSTQRCDLLCLLIIIAKTIIRAIATMVTATSEERAWRRCKELKEKGQVFEYDQILKDIIDRDENDSKRAFAPLVKTPDSIEIDSTKMTIDEVADYILSFIK